MRGQRRQVSCCEKADGGECAQVWRVCCITLYGGQASVVAACLASYIPVTVRSILSRVRLWVLLLSLSHRRRLNFVARPVLLVVDMSSTPCYCRRLPARECSPAQPHQSTRSGKRHRHRHARTQARAHTRPLMQQHTIPRRSPPSHMRDACA